MNHLVFICRHERHHDRNLWCSGLQQCHIFAKITPTELNPSPMSHGIQKNAPDGIYINPSWECFPSTNAGGKKKHWLSQRLTQELSQELWPELDMELRQKRHDVIAALGKSWVGGTCFFWCTRIGASKHFLPTPAFLLGALELMLSGFLRWQVLFFCGGGDII